MLMPDAARRLVSLLTIGLLAAAAGGADNRNGATWYQRAFGVQPQLTSEQWNLIDRYRANPVGPPPAALREALGQANGAMGHIRRGSRQRYSDYRLDVTQGFALPVPHLAQSRGLARIMQADALVRLHDGDTATAMDRITSIYRMSGHVGQDRIVISSLVGQAVWNTGDQALQVALDRGMIGQDEAAVMLEAARTLPSSDPFGYAEAVMMEHEFVVQTLGGHTGEDGLVHLDALLPEGTEVPGGMNVMTAEERDAQLDLFGEYIEQVAEVFVENDTERGPEQLAELEQRLEAGEFGQIARVFAPALGRAFDLKQEAEGKLAARIETLEALAAGDQDAMAHANAAVWYLRAVELLHRRTPAQLAALRADLPDPGQPLDPVVASLLEQCDDVLATLREASRIERCDFAFAHEPLRPPAPALSAPYALGLRDLQHLILADGRRHGDAPGPLLDRLRIGWTMIRHCETDPMYTTAISSHLAFNRLVALTTGALERGVLGAEQRSELYGLANRLRRTDPFGYVAATVQAREDMSRHFFRRMIYTDALPQERYDALEKTVKTFAADLLLCLAAVLDTMRHAGDDDFEVHKALFALLDGIYDLEALEQARNLAPELAPLLADYRMEQLAERTVPDIGGLRNRQGEARRDLRVGLQALRPPPPPQAAGATPPATPDG